MIDSTLNVSNLLISNPVTSDEFEIREVFFNETQDLTDTTGQESVDPVDSKPRSFRFDIQCPDINNDLSSHLNNGIVNNNISLEHRRENQALLKLWNVTASEFFLIPCQLESLKESVIVNDNADLSISASVDLRSPETKTHRCDCCNNDLEDLGSLLLHYKQVHQLFKCPFCVKHFARSHLLRAHLFVHSNRREFVCSVCKKQFKRNCNLKQHIKRQHLNQALATETFLCDSCGFQSKSKNSIRFHVLGHLGIESYVCKECFKRCRNKTELNDHRNTHYNIKSYQCDVCNIFFARKEAMIKHRRTQHEGLYSYMCDVCGRNFLHKTSLTVHMKLHTGENQIECNVCGKMMSGKVALLNHKKMHNQQRDFVCGICGKAYINKYSLQEHLLVHTGSNPFQCLQCDNSFSSRKKLLMHERIHDPNRTVYGCSHCEKSYLSKFKLQAHIGKHHAIVERGII